MTVRNLDALFRPKSIAVIGASSRAGSVGQMVWSQLKGGAFAGPIWPVSPGHRDLDGHPVFASINALPDAPSVAVLCTAPSTWPGLVGELGARGTRAVVIIGHAARALPNQPADEWTQRTLAAA